MVWLLLTMVVISGTRWAALLFNISNVTSYCLIFGRYSMSKRYLLNKGRNSFDAVSAVSWNRTHRFYDQYELTVVDG